MSAERKRWKVKKDLKDHEESVEQIEKCEIDNRFKRDTMEQAVRI